MCTRHLSKVKIETSNFCRNVLATYNHKRLMVLRFTSELQRDVTLVFRRMSPAEYLTLLTCIWYIDNQTYEISATTTS